MIVQFRAPPPMSFHPNHVIGRVVVKDKEGERMKVFTVGGKKSTTLSNLRIASSKGRGEIDAY